MLKIDLSVGDKVFFPGMGFISLDCKSGQRARLEIDFPVEREIVVVKNRARMIDFDGENLKDGVFVYPD